MAQYSHPPVIHSCVAGGWCVEGLGCPFVSSCGLFLPAEGVVEDVEDAEEEEGIACPCEVTVVFLDFVEEHVGGDVEGEPVAEEGEDGVPYQGAERGEDGELGYVHARYACRNRNELAYGGNETSDEGRYGSVTVEVFFCFLHFRPVDETGVSQSAVGEAVDHRTTDPEGEVVVDKRSDKGTKGGEHYNEVDVHVAAGSGVGACQIRRRGHNHFGGEGYETAFDDHEYEYKQIAGMVNKPLEKLAGVKYRQGYHV